ncbi:hypothetical protein P154DRAFT_457086 [Amniculicola lignicola CBS 123094]|uniref:Saponin hydrolase n=1 Tax=Amniculicola lignicola CBS 123094 TaxID=1392246 RepID=A0A6A5WV24_9PLEO|nr:hypothetical protein P154DRAFT_457086 [Amniculicola lignicola CBS 123094]
MGFLSRSLVLWLSSSALPHAWAVAPPPEPEPISIAAVPLPPGIANTSVGACTTEVNPHGTGCITIVEYPRIGTGSGSFLPDGIHITAYATFTGAPAAPHPASIYTGLQLIIIKTDGKKFPNGDSWKCITCGVPDKNKVGSTELDPYPQSFSDGIRVITGINVVSCGVHQLTSTACTPAKTFIYPIRWSSTANDSGEGPGGTIREVRLHPDQVHLAFNAYIYVGGQIGEVGLIGRLKFNATGTNGMDPRYELTNVNLLSNPNLPPPLSLHGKDLSINTSAIAIGELRGWTGTGQEVTYVGYPVESCNMDLFAVSLKTGVVRRITAHPEYPDPIAVSPDDKWQVVLDTRGSDRLMFMSALRTVPAILDIIVAGAVSSVRNNGPRRFFQPWLLDYDGDRGTYFGQKINAAGDGTPGSINDPNWNAGADPRWSDDGTKIVYFQMLTTPPSCGPPNSLPCEVSTEPYRQETRIFVATLTSRKPLPKQKIQPLSDNIPWAIPYTAGMEITISPPIPAGTYTLKGGHSGSAKVTIGTNPTTGVYTSVSAIYNNFNNGGAHTIDGFENVTTTPINVTTSKYDWYSNVTSRGDGRASKFTSPNGFHLTLDFMTNFFDAEGNLTTVINGKTYHQPGNFM